MTVYFLTRNDDPKGLVKIGHTGDIEKRIANLSVSVPEGMVLLATCDGGWEVEAYLHEALAEHRVSKEWFNPHPDVMRWVDQAKFVGRLNLPIPADRSERHAAVATPRSAGAAGVLKAIADTEGMSRPSAAAFLLRRLAQVAHRGHRIDTWETARDRAARAAGLKLSMAKRIWLRHEHMKDVSGEALHALMVAYEKVAANPRASAFSGVVSEAVG